MKDKEILSYKRALKECLRICIFKPKYIFSDFELRLRNAISSVFPLARYKGCYFYFVNLFGKEYSNMNA